MITKATPREAGFTLTETLISLAILAFVITATMAVIQHQLRITSDESGKLSFSIARNELITLLQRRDDWAFTLSGAGSTAYDCIAKQDSLNASERDCSTAGGPVIVYDNRGDVILDGSSPGAGLNVHSGFCTTFVDPALGPGDRTCPIGVTLRWTPICPGTPCENPSIKVTARFKLNGTADQGNLNVAYLDFDLIRSNLTCPAQPTPIAPANIANTTVTATAVLSNEVGSGPSTARGRLLPSLIPCQRFEIRYKDTLNTGSSVALNSADNQAGVCLVAATDPSTCIYEYRRFYDAALPGSTFELKYNGTVVYSKPPSITLADSSVLRFRVNRGLVSFCIDNDCLYTFDGKLEGPTQAVFIPARTGYSPGGFSTISYTTF